MKERPVVESHSSQSRSSIGGAVGCCGDDDVMIVIVVLCCCEGYDYHISYLMSIVKKLNGRGDESRHIFLEKQKERRERVSFATLRKNQCDAATSHL